MPSAAVVEAIQQTAQVKRVVLDPIQPGKTLAGLFCAARWTRFHWDETVVLLHRGVDVALHAGPSSLNRPRLVSGEALSRPVRGMIPT